MKKRGYGAAYKCFPNTFHGEIPEPCSVNSVTSNQSRSAERAQVSVNVKTQYALQIDSSRDQKN